VLQQSQTARSTLARGTRDVTHFTHAPHQPAHLWSQDRVGGAYSDRRTSRSLYTPSEASSIVSLPPAATWRVLPTPRPGTTWCARTACLFHITDEGVNSPVDLALPRRRAMPTTFKLLRRRCAQLASQTRLRAKLCAACEEVEQGARNALHTRVLVPIGPQGEEVTQPPDDQVSSGSASDFSSEIDDAVRGLVRLRALPSYVTQPPPKTGKKRKSDSQIDTSVKSKVRHSPWPTASAVMQSTSHRSLRRARVTRFSRCASWYRGP
jgi:hypothetical protein